MKYDSLAEATSKWREAEGQERVCPICGRRENAPVVKQEFKDELKAQGFVENRNRSFNESLNKEKPKNAQSATQWGKSTGFRK